MEGHPGHSIEIGRYLTSAVAAFLTLTAGGAVIVGAASWAIGKLDLLGQSDDGFNTTINAEIAADGVAKIVLEFDTSIGYGSVEVGKAGR